MHVQHVGDVLPLDLPQHVDEPFKVPVGWTNPQEINLHCGKIIRIGYDDDDDYDDDEDGETFLQATPEYRLVDVPKTRSLRMEA